MTFAGRTLTLTRSAPFRYYYLTRNRIRLVGRHSRRHPAWAAGQVVGVAGHLGLVLAFDPQRGSRAREAWRGIRDGVRGRTGATTGRLTVRIRSRPVRTSERNDFVRQGVSPRTAAALGWRLPDGGVSMTTVRAALVQTTWTGDKDSMIDKHEEYARDAAAQGAQVICFQELFYGPYFCQVQDSQFYEYAEAVPGPTTERFQALAKELKLVIVLPVYEREDPFLYNTAAVIDADGSYLGKYRKQHIPHVGGFWEKFYFRPGNGGYPVFDTAVGKVGVYICYDRHFPEGWRALGLNGAQIVFNPSATSRGLSEYLWSIEQPAAAVANEYYVGAINRVGIEDLGDDDFYGQSYFVDPEGNYVGDKGDAHKPELIIRDLDLDLIQTVRERWAFYRDRRPDAYDDLVTP